MNTDQEGSATSAEEADSGNNNDDDGDDDDNNDRDEEAILTLRERRAREVGYERERQHQQQQGEEEGGDRRDRDQEEEQQQRQQPRVPTRRRLATFDPVVIGLPTVTTRRRASDGAPTSGDAGGGAGGRGGGDGDRSAASEIGAAGSRSRTRPSVRGASVGSTNSIRFGRRAGSDDDEDGMEDMEWGDGGDGVYAAPSSYVGEVDAVESFGEGEGDEAKGAEPEGSDARAPESRPSGDDVPEEKATRVDVRELARPGSDLGSDDGPAGEDETSRAEGDGGDERVGKAAAAARRRQKGNTRARGSVTWEYSTLGASSPPPTLPTTTMSDPNEESDKAYGALMEMMRSSDMLTSSGRDGDGDGASLSEDGDTVDALSAFMSSMAPLPRKSDRDRVGGKSHGYGGGGGNKSASSLSSAALPKPQWNGRRGLFARRCARAMATFALLGALSGALVYLAAEEEFDAVMNSLRGISGSDRMAVLKDEDDEHEREWEVEEEEETGVFVMPRQGDAISSEEEERDDMRRRRAQRRRGARAKRKERTNQRMMMRMSANTAHNRDGGRSATTQDPGERINHFHVQEERQSDNALVVRGGYAPYLQQQQHQDTNRYPKNNNMMPPQQEGSDNQQDNMYSWRDVYQMYVDELKGGKMMPFQHHHQEGEEEKEQEGSPLSPGSNNVMVKFNFVLMLCRFKCQEIEGLGM